MINKFTYIFVNLYIIIVYNIEFFFLVYEQGAGGYPRRQISYTNINFDSTYNPIIIDQQYCPNITCQKISKKYSSSLISKNINNSYA